MTVAHSQQRGPAAVVVLAVVAVAFFVLPLVALAVNVPWSQLGALGSDPVVRDALGLSLVASVASTMLSVILGVPLAWVLARTRFPGRSLVRAVVMLPLVLPPVVAGTALLFAWGRRGLIGGPINDATGLLLPFSLWGVIVAGTFVAMPFLVLTVGGALVSDDGTNEQAAATLGASPSTVFWRITLPRLAPTIGVAAVLAWARAIGEFGATVTFAGNLQGRTQTLPLAVFVARESDQDLAAVLSLVMIAVSLVVLLALRDRWWGRW